jgi:hypothetical protein
MNKPPDPAAIRQQIEGLRHMTVGHLKDKYREVFGEETRSNQQAVSIPPHRLAHPGECRGRPFRTRPTARAGDCERRRSSHSGAEELLERRGR